MKVEYGLYTIHDRLIDWFMQPFIGPSDKGVMNAVAETINSEESTNAVAYAPHHFEIWKIAEITETGEVKPCKQLIADCASLVREDLWEARTRRGGRSKSGPQPQPGDSGGPRTDTRTGTSPHADAPLTEALQAQGNRQGPEGLHPGHDGRGGNDQTI